MDELVNCGNPNDKLLPLKETLRNSDLRRTNELINSSPSNLSPNTLNSSSLLFDHMKQFKTSIQRAWRTLIAKAGI